MRMRRSVCGNTSTAFFVVRLHATLIHFFIFLEIYSSISNAGKFASVSLMLADLPVICVIPKSMNERDANAIVLKDLQLNDLFFWEICRHKWIFEILLIFIFSVVECEEKTCHICIYKMIHSFSIFVRKYIVETKRVMHEAEMKNMII